VKNVSEFTYQPAQVVSSGTINESNRGQYHNAPGVAKKLREICSYESALNLVQRPENRTRA